MLAEARPMLVLQVMLNFLSLRLRLICCARIAGNAGMPFIINVKKLVNNWLAVFLLVDQINGHRLTKEAVQRLRHSRNEIAGKVYIC